MQHLPYELLQHISSSLLPRSQCRLALASKHCYKYLYLCCNVYKFDFFVQIVNMDLTCVLPYELLQLISEYLLPCYQCRLALVSRHNYKYLYNDLLRWYAKWRQIKSPLYKCSTDISLLQFGKMLILFQLFGGELLIRNLTTLFGINVEYYLQKSSQIEYYDLDICSLECIYEDNKIKRMLHGCYKNMHKYFLIAYINSQQPVMTLTRDLIYFIGDKLDPKSSKGFCQLHPFPIYL